MMEMFLYGIVVLISRIHGFIMQLNDQVEYSFTDKELHFIVIAFLGMAILFVVHPLFKWLSESGHTIVISFIYVFTVIVVITFAIEIGQKITNTGNMEFADIVYGIFGFLAAFVLFAIVRGVVLLIWRHARRE